MRKLTHHVGEHDVGFGDRLCDVLSEIFLTAPAAAKWSAERQHLEGQDAQISCHLADARRQRDRVAGGDRPHTVVVDDDAWAAR